VFIQINYSYGIYCLSRDFWKKQWFNEKS